jgi:hypothetical protein
MLQVSSHESKNGTQLQSLNERYTHLVVDMMMMNIRLVQPDEKCILILDRIPLLQITTSLGLDVEGFNVVSGLVCSIVLDTHPVK